MSETNYELLDRLDTMNGHLSRISGSLEEIDSKMPFEERELAAWRAETESGIRMIYAMIIDHDLLVNPSNFERGVTQANQFFKDQMEKYLPWLKEDGNG